MGGLGLAAAVHADETGDLGAAGAAGSLGADAQPAARDVGRVVGGEDGRRHERGDDVPVDEDQARARRVDAQGREEGDGHDGQADADGREPPRVQADGEGDDGGEVLQVEAHADADAVEVRVAEEVARHVGLGGRPVVDAHEGGRRVALTHGGSGGGGCCSSPSRSEVRCQRTKRPGFVVMGSLSRHTERREKEIPKEKSSRSGQLISSQVPS